MMETVLVTGANRGIGLACVTELLRRGNRVIAATRKPDAKGLQKLEAQYADNLQTLPLEVTDDGAVSAAFQTLSESNTTVDVLVNMAGVMSRPHDQPLATLDLDQCISAFQINALGPLRVLRACLPLLRHSNRPRIINITSGCGSLSLKDNGHFYAYAASKAALNMLSRTVAFEYESDGICCIALDPGWVKTDLGGPDAHLEPEQSASAICDTIDRLTPADTSKFLRYDGQEVPW